MAQIKLDTKTYCVGRHLVDVPTPFVPATITTGVFKTAGLGAQDPSIEIVVRASGLTPSQFDTEVRKRRDEIARKGDDTTDVLRLAKKLTDQETLFRVQSIDDAYVSEINLLRGTNWVTITLESYDRQFLQAEQRLLAFAAEIEESAVQTKSGQIRGFCLGPVVINGRFKDQSGSFLFRDGKGDDLGIEIASNPSSKEAPLLTRMSGPGSLLSKFDVKHAVLRARERNVAGFQGQEWLGWTKLGEDMDEKTFGFAWEAMPQTSPKDELGMTLSFESAQPLKNGTPTKNVLSDEEALAIWDTILESIRPAKS